MSDSNGHGVDVEEDTELETAEDATSSKDDPEAVPDEAMPDQDPGRDDTDGEAREEAAAEQENPDANRDEEPYQS
ncbi:hypothetical protein [Halobaculum marinum]|uniref:Uncharacterized protein n=1 Tax=Halobaculum marinum TaxID=3031996 RepID=A0ABD5WX75_9EURY|nr:hypothetical protein [Halobaculum sp. DT55]